MINVGIDASNIISGGGLTHLVEILRAVDIKKHGINNLDVWAAQNTLDKIDSIKGIRLKSHFHLEGNLLQRVYWQQAILTKFAKDNYDVLYVPGGSYTGNFRPFVTMNRNLLPFDLAERERYGFSFQRLRLKLLEKIQSRAYSKADGVIFLSQAARRITEQTTGKKLPRSKIIPHGIASDFLKKPEKQKPINEYSFENPYHFLYVSTVTVYKHQWHVIEAVYKLRREGYPVVLDLVGGITSKKGREWFSYAQKKYDPDDEFIFYHGHKNYDEIKCYYRNADGFIFASSCETFGQTLLEAMASGLPIACSDHSAMPEVLHNTGQYFEPEDPDSIARALKRLLDSTNLRQKLAMQAYKRSQTYSWEKCAAETFGFIQQVHKKANL